MGMQTPPRISKEDASDVDFMVPATNGNSADVVRPEKQQFKCENVSASIFFSKRDIQESIRCVTESTWLELFFYRQAYR